MRTHRVIHGLAILSLIVVAAMSVIGSLRQFPGAPPEMRFAPLVGLAIWSFLLWKIWRRPRKWGLGVGIFLFLMIAFQSYLWWLGVNNPKLEAQIPEASRSVANFILIYELPIFVAGVCCILLRFSNPHESFDHAAKCARPCDAANRLRL